MKLINTLLAGSVFKPLNNVDIIKEAYFIADNIIELKICDNLRINYFNIYDINKPLLCYCGTYCILCKSRIKNGVSLQHCNMEEKNINLHTECINIINNILANRPEMTIKYVARITLK